jgi:two-component system sensor kinase FixL
MRHTESVPTTRQAGNWHPVLRTVATVLLFAAAYFVLQRLTFTLRFPPYQRTTIWAPGALLFTAFLLAPPLRWWVYYTGLCIGVYAAYYGDTAIPETSALLAAQFHFVAVASGVLVMRRLGAGAPFGNTASLLAFVPVATVLVPVLTTGPIDAMRFVSGAPDVWPVAVRSALCVALGVLITTPALTLTFANGLAGLRTEIRRRGVEIAGLAAALAVAGFFCFEWPAGATASPALLCAPLPLLLWAAMRLGLAAVCWALVVVAYQSTRGAVHGNGPFASHPPAEMVLEVQFFLFAVSLPLMLLATVIEERRRAVATLAEREQEVRGQYAQLATIYHTAPVGLAFVDLELRLVNVNDFLADLNGLPAEAHIGQTVRQIFPRYADTIEPDYRHVIETGHPVVNVEVHGAPASPSAAGRCWVLSHYPVKDAAGALLGVNTVVQEITERKRTEERFRLVVESTPTAVVIVDAAGKIVLINSRCEQLFGYRRKALLGQSVDVLVPERFRRAHTGHRAAFSESPTARPMAAGHELYGRHKDGSEIPVEISLTPIQAAEGPLVLCAIVDVTERKRADEARQELAHASRLALMGELTASIAHEINQPLGAILSNADAAEMLLEASPAPLDEVRQILEDIRKDDLRASEVIRRLRALLRKREMELQPVDVNDLTAEVMLLVRAESLRRGVVVETGLTPGLPPVRGDKVHLQQVLLNLLLNGMEAMAGVSGEKKLTVRTALNSKGYVEVAVGDAGAGVAPDRLPRLFEPFFSTKAEGMGLGLSIARSLVEAHGGRIRAENAPRGGAVFSFELPACGEQAGRESRAAEKVLGGAIP